MSRYSQHYLNALKKYLAPRGASDLEGAAHLGEVASELGLATLAVARIHDVSLALVELADGNEERANRSEAFFDQVIMTMVASRRASGGPEQDRKVVQEELEKRTTQLAAAHLQLRQAVQKHKDLETTLKENGECHAKLLKESLRLQTHFQRLTHQVLATQEVERKKISRELNEEVAQTLLGINFRLASLRLVARGSAHGIKDEIASTQKLAVRSARSVRLVARRLGKP